MGQSSEFVAAGFLASYGPDFNASFATAASFVSRILRAAKPADLPIEQVTKLELVVNLKTARVLGLKVPQARAIRLPSRPSVRPWLSLSSSPAPAIRLAPG